MAALVRRLRRASVGCEISLDGQGVVVREERRFQVSGAPDLALTTFDGSIRVESWDRNEIRVEIEKRGSTPRALALRADTGNGPIDVRGMSGRVAVESGDGSIDVRGQLRFMRLDTGDGPVTAVVDDGSVAVEDWTVRTGDGSITLDLPRRFSAELDATTNDGRVSAAGATITASEGDEDEPQLLRGRVGTGGPTIRLRTGDGPIDIRTR